MYVMIDNFDSFTYNVYQYLTELTPEEIRVFRNDALSVDELEALNPRGLIISPGPGDPDQAGISLEAISRFKGRIPILGICLGHQCIAQAFGGKIVGAAAIVHGKTANVRHDGRGLFRGLSNPAVFTRYHSLAAERATLPDCLEVTATSSDGEIMGIRHRDYPIEGVQFHPESIASEQGKRLLANFLNYRLEPYPLRENLSRLIEGISLSREEAMGFMRELTEGALTPTQIGAYLVALNAKGVVPEELAGFAALLQEKRVKVKGPREVLDIVGTGGDEHGTFNISSLSALIAAACGACVAKHGNRAVSSRSGASDFYASLGIKIDIEPARAEKMMAEADFAFLFAPVYHGAMKHAAQPRAELGIKTVMNMLGPLVNPAGAEYQLIGVFNQNMCKTQARAAHLLGVRRVMVVHGSDGTDELTVTGPSRVVMIDENGQERDFRFDPADLGISGYTLQDLQGGSAAENAAEARSILAGGGRPAIRDAVCLNAGAALYLYDSVESIADGYQAARKALESGAVQAKLEQVIRLSNEQ